MLRSFLIFLSKADWAKRLVTNWSFARRMASRFIAGEELADAIRVVQSLNSKGINATLDHLGEHTTTEEESRKATLAILDMLDELDRAKVRSNISIKLSQIGLAIDIMLCEQNLEKILAYAQERGIFVRLDMEDSSLVDPTLDIYRKMVDYHGFTNTGVVIQSYLYRSKGDIEQMVQTGARVRLCKGAYKEPEEIAYPQKRDVDQAYDDLARKLVDGIVQNGSIELSSDGKFPPLPAFATHDPIRIRNIKNYIDELSLPPQTIEFQMLHGIRRDLQEQTVLEGFPVRVYVPFGTQWYPYFVRRLAERPANLWFFISNYFHK